MEVSSFFILYLGRKYLSVVWRCPLLRGVMGGSIVDTNSYHCTISTKVLDDDMWQIFDGYC